MHRKRECRMRKIHIVYENEEKVEREYKEFFDDMTDWDIDDYCYEVIENRYDNSYWFFWSEEKD